MQPGQYSRRKYAGWRIFPVQVMTFGMLDFKGLGIYRQTLKSGFKKGFNNMRGTLKRFIKLRKEGYGFKGTF